MRMFFVYQGDLPTNLYIDRLSRLTGARVVAAFNSRSEAIDHALNLDTSAVVVERTFNLMAGDDNNLIAECEWDDSWKELPAKPTSEPEPEQEEVPAPKPLIPLTGKVDIDGSLQVGEMLTADLSGLDGDGEPVYEWARAETSGSVPVIIPGENKKTYVLGYDDVNQYIVLVVGRIGYEDNILSDPAGPVVA